MFNKCCVGLLLCRKNEMENLNETNRDLEENQTNKTQNTTSENTSSQETNRNELDQNKPQKENTKPKNKKKIVALIVGTLIIVGVITAYTTHSIMSKNTQDTASETNTSATKTPKSSTQNSSTQTYGITVKDPSKALPDITDETTLQFIKEIGAYDPTHTTAYGDQNAPLTIIEFSDFSCPMCAKFHTDSYPNIEKLVDQGLARVKYIPYVTFKTYGSDIAAAGAVAAGKQGKFREYSNLLFSKATQTGHEQYTKESVTELAKQAGVTNIDEFMKIINDPKVYEELEANVLKISSWGISGTPSTIVGNAFVYGAMPDEHVSATLVDQLRKAQGK